MKAYSQINSSAFAATKLQALSRSSGLNVDFVRAVANFTWDYDRDRPRKESNGWVELDPDDRTTEDGIALIATTLGLERNWSVSASGLIPQLLQAHMAIDPTAVWREFECAIASKSYWKLSRFATFSWLRGASAERLAALQDRHAEYRLSDLATALFLKLFRGGCLERSRLLYAWADLTGIGHAAPPADMPSGNVAEALAASFTETPPATLSELLATCKGAIGGDKLFRQEALQALSYANLLQVNEHPITDIWLPGAQRKLSRHFYSNEWTYPLRFWGEAGGRFNSEALPKAA